MVEREARGGRGERSNAAGEAEEDSRKSTPSERWDRDERVR